MNAILRIGISLIFLAIFSNCSKENVSENNSVKNEDIGSLTKADFLLEKKYLTDHPDLNVWADHFKPHEVYINWNLYSKEDENFSGWLSIILNPKNSKSENKKINFSLGEGEGNLDFELHDLNFSISGLRLKFLAKTSLQSDGLNTNIDYKYSYKEGILLEGHETIERAAENSLKLKYRNVLFSSVNQLPQMTIWVQKSK